MAYKYEDIGIGEQVYFDDKSQSNHDLYWTVIEKSANRLLIIELKEMGYDERYAVTADQIRSKLPGSINKK